MKISELRACLQCDGPILGPGKGGQFYVIRSSIALVNPQNWSGVTGVMQIVGGGRESMAALRVAEVMAPSAEDAVSIGGEKYPELWNEAVICSDCYMKSDIPIWNEKANERRKKEEGKTEGE